MKKKIYLDHSATTPLDPAVLKTMLPYQSEMFGNASSVHSFGQEASKAVEKSRGSIAKFLHCNPNEVFFTSGATESDNIVILGIAKRGEHIITSKIEHPAILEACREVEKRGVKVTYVNVDKRGIIKLSELKKAIRPNTKLVSIMYVNNEVGTIQPIAEIGKIISAKNRFCKNKIYFHTDAVQAANYCEMDVQNLKVDLLSLSGHKIYGPKGIGVLFARKGLLISPIQYGGHQEKGVRPGTYNTAGIVGLGKAVELLNTKTPNYAKASLGRQKHPSTSLEAGSENAKIKKLRDYLIKEVKKRIPDVVINGDLKNRTPNNVNFSFKGAEGESILLMLDFEGIAVSTGSACSSGSLEPSHVLTAMGISPELAHGSLRITLGKENTRSEIDRVIEALPKIITKLRKISPFR